MGVHALAFLGLRSGECFTSQDIARSTNTNAVVVRRILAALHEAGLVTTHRGPNGGARLTRTPECISLAEIYRAVESGDTFSMHHTPPNKRCPVGGIIQEALERVFDEAQEALEKELERTRLADILSCVAECPAGATARKGRLRESGARAAA